MSDLVTRLRNWREVHIERLHILMEEAADEVAILRSKLSLRDNLEQGLMDGVARLQAEVERLRNGALEARETVSQDGDCPEPDNAANRDTLIDTPATHATPSEGSEQNRCTLDDEERVSLCSETPAIGETPSAPTLTDEEREAVGFACSRLTADTHYASVAATLRGLLERTK